MYTSCRGAGVVQRAHHDVEMSVGLSRRADGRTLSDNGID